MNAQLRIQARVRARIKELGLKQEVVADRVNSGDLYGEFTHGSFRNLLTETFEPQRKPRTTFNKQLLIALSDALECTVPDLADDIELSQIRDLPYRRAQWPEFMLEEFNQEKPRASVAVPTVTAARIVAYSKQHAYNNAKQLAERMRENGYRISTRNMQYVWETKPDPKKLARIVTWEFCEAIARVFRGRTQSQPFAAAWLIKCQPTCPHCDSRYIDY